MKLALKALKECRCDPRLKYEHPTYDTAIKALEEALKQEQVIQTYSEKHNFQQEQGEPVACNSVSTEVLKFLNGEAPLDGVWFGEDHPTERGSYWWRKRLNTTPQQRTAAEGEDTRRAWVGLTNDEMDWLHANTPCIEGNYGYRFIKAIEAKLKDKNT